MVVGPSPTTILIMNELRVKIVARFIFVVILLFTAIYPQKPRITTTNLKITTTNWGVVSVCMKHNAPPIQPVYFSWLCSPIAG